MTQSTSRSKIIYNKLTDWLQIHAHFQLTWVGRSFKSDMDFYLLNHSALGNIGDRK